MEDHLDTVFDSLSYYKQFVCDHPTGNFVFNCKWIFAIAC